MRRMHSALSVWAVRSGGTVAVLLLAVVATSFGQTSVLRVEEDWEVVLREPDPAVNAPQVTTVMAAQGSEAGLHMAFEMNHQTQPDFVAGGMQLQAWYGDYLLAFKQFNEYGALSQEGETIAWTQSISLNDGMLIYEIENGNSHTWGSFGGEGDIRISVGTYLTDLANYCEDCSVADSKVSFANNRVERLVLKEVRRYGATGLISTDTTDRVVYRHP